MLATLLLPAATVFHNTYAIACFLVGIYAAGPHLTPGSNAVRTLTAMILCRTPRIVFLLCAISAASISAFAQKSYFFNKLEIKVVHKQEQIETDVES